VLLLAALLAGRLLDRFDLPFERDSTQPDEPAVSTTPVPAAIDSPRVEEAATEQPRPAARGTEPSPVELPLSINRATALELQRLPGVGPVLASRIVAERDSGGRFDGPADLQRVKGIGAATSARLAPHLRFD
jgi:competence ComEA-like helix-hairpin-helix protein